MEKLIEFDYLSSFVETERETWHKMIMMKINRTERTN